MLDHPLKIGALTVPNRVLLSPMAGVSDVPFRRVCQELGAGLTYVEMLSANALVHRAPNTNDMLVRHPAERQLGVQVTGPSAEAVAEAVGLLDTQAFDTIDINMGCPVRKIVARGSGSAILKDPDRVERTVRLARERTRAPLTAKIRLGYTPQTRNVEEVARRLAGAGVAMITIHGRTRDDRYDVPVDLAGIAAGVVAARAAGGPDVVVTGNGDIFDAAQARRMVEGTGCDAVLIGRGALGNPWIFRQIVDPAFPHPRPAEWREVLLRHLAYHREHYGPGQHAVAQFRKHLLWYAAGFPHARRLRDALGNVSEFDDVIELVDRCVASMDPERRRYATDQHSQGLRATHDPTFDMDREADRAAALQPVADD